MTRAEAIDTIVAIVLRGIEQRESLPARQAAEAAWYPGHELGSVEAIEAAIIQRRKEDAELIAEMDAAKVTAAS